MAGRVRDGATVLVAEDENAGVVDSVTLLLDDGPLVEHRCGIDGDAGFRMLAVDPAAEGRGAARALLDADDVDTIERARDAGRTRIVISSLPTMTRAHVLYERAGFVRRPDLDRDFRVAVGHGYALDL
ncbi:MAG: GNAT family N-acetyltransferase [Nitriliruptorales bacterium]